ncbi:ABC transporter ATP-binding protein [Chryseobacterium sp. GMJ5]|uniref:ABC transporter ATP-binding protein n=1 Tax=Chryseobacterium gilvum TaxID=2976534 RepID=A0ABT2VZM3_9FLAO|nr:ABC transporter ATP-binding protein [Chryseobacterium gilvum]MCU7613925.1 ABC transporter ATP-binding protein [Chryseobacterium gilvum]
MVLEINNVSYQKNKKEILSHINFSVDKGIYAVLGSNGAGKSTLLKVISTLLAPTEGAVTFHQKPVKNNKQYLAAMSYMPQNVGLIKEFDIVDNLHYFGLLKGCKDSELKIKISEIITDFDLDAVKNMTAYNLSGGVIQRIGIALSLLNAPAVLLLDEPFNSLDSSERNRLYSILRKISENTTVIISTHLIAEIENAADEFILMKDGAVTFKGNKHECIDGYMKSPDRIREKNEDLDKTVFEEAVEYYTKYW